MKKIYSCLLSAILIGTFSCTNGNMSNTEGETLIDPELKELGELNSLVLQYDDVSNKVGDYLVVKSHNKWGVINLKGDTIIGFEYDEITKDHENYWSIKTRSPNSSNNFNVGIAKMDGTVLLPPVNDGNKCGLIAEGLYYIKKSDGYAFFDSNGEEVILTDEESGYEIPYPKEVHEFGKNCFMALLANTKWYRIFFTKGDEKNCKVDTVNYTDVKICGNLCYVKNEEGKWGAIDVNGSLVIPYIYSDARKRGEGINSVFVQNGDGKWGFVKGNEMIGSYDNFMFSCDKYAYVKDGKYDVVIDSNGKEIFRTEDLYEQRKFDGVFKGLHHIYDSNGKTIMTVNDSLRIEDYVNGYVSVYGEENGYSAILDKKGKVVVPFDDILFIKGKQSIYSVKLFTDSDSIITNLFNTKSGEYIELPFIIESFEGEYYLVKIENRHIFIDEQGKTGFTNFEEILNEIKKRRKANEMAIQNELEDSIKEQIIKCVNEKFGKEIIALKSGIEKFEKKPDGTYTAEFTDYGEYEHIVYTLYDIEVDKNGVMQNCAWKMKMVIPTDKKPEGTMDVEEAVRRNIGAVGRINH